MLGSKRLRLGQVSQVDSPLRVWRSLSNVTLTFVVHTPHTHCPPKEAIVSDVIVLVWTFPGVSVITGKALQWILTRPLLSSFLTVLIWAVFQAAICRSAISDPLNPQWFIIQRGEPRIWRHLWTKSEMKGSELKGRGQICRKWEERWKVRCERLRQKK